MTQAKSGNQRRPQVSKKETREIVYRAIERNLGEELRKRWAPDCCIAATRAALTICELYDIVAQPVLVRVQIFNRGMVERMGKYGPPTSLEMVKLWESEVGAWSVGVGFGKDPRPNRWPGHLVLLTEDGMLIDPSIAQADRPGRGIKLPACVVRHTTDGFANGKEPFSFVGEGGIVISYRVAEEDTKADFRKSSDWTDCTITNPMAMDIGRIIGRELTELSDGRRAART